MRPHYHGLLVGLSDISIHAPTWGATPSSNPHRRPPRISIHAPTWGATRLSVDRLELQQFQSTHPRGVRQEQQYEWNPKLFISIHAPTWGATLIQKPLCVPPRNFNPRTHVGCDTAGMEQVPDDLIFQSTHPRGVRLPCCQRCAQTDNFNPRTHVGCDIIVQTGLCNFRISIHAPTWGATLR